MDVLLGYLGSIVHNDQAPLGEFYSSKGVVHLLSQVTRPRRMSLTRRRVGGHLVKVDDVPVISVVAKGLRAIAALGALGNIAVRLRGQSLEGSTLVQSERLVGARRGNQSGRYRSAHLQNMAAISDISNRDIYGRGRKEILTDC